MRVDFDLRNEGGGGGEGGVTDEKPASNCLEYPDCRSTALGILRWSVIQVLRKPPICGIVPNY